MKNQNLLIIMDDEHSSKVLGCYGNSIVKTPNIDKLAASGTLFSSAYSTSPICVPARAVFATGQYPHQTGYWDNCLAYDGKIKSWGHRLQENKKNVISIGKLHYLDNESPTGFDKQILPMHIVDGGDIHGLVRDEPIERLQCADLAAHIGPGETKYIKYDRRITEETCTWLNSKKDLNDKDNWCCFVSFISPHYPLISPPEFYDLYNPIDLPLPKQRPNDGTADTEWWKAFENCYIWDRFFKNDEDRRIAIASYYGLCSFIDNAVGKIMATLKSTGLDKSTRVIFLSDHGESLGSRGLWGKSTMYDESISIPLIISGEGIPKGRVCETPVSLIDLYPTILEAMSVIETSSDKGRFGKSLFNLIKEPDLEREIMCEYYATGSISASYMLRKGDFKYIYYLGYGSELYNIREDPEEIENLASKSKYKELVNQFNAKLRKHVDPEKADKRAKNDQNELIKQYGGRKAIAKKKVASATPAPV